MNDVTLSPSGYNSPAAQRLAAQTFIKLTNSWRKPKTVKDEDHPDLEDALAYHAMENFVKPEASLEYLTMRKLGKQSFMGIIVSLPGDVVGISVHYFHFKYGACTHMAVKGFNNMDEVKQEIRITL